MSDPNLGKACGGVDLFDGSAQDLSFGSSLADFLTEGSSAKCPPKISAPK
jgi:hypothetical protein